MPEKKRSPPIPPPFFFKRQVMVGDMQFRNMKSNPDPDAKCP